MDYRTRMRNLREDNDLTQKEIADYLNIKQKNYLMKKKKKRLPINLFFIILF